MASTPVLTPRPPARAGRPPARPPRAPARGPRPPTGPARARRRARRSTGGIWVLAVLVVAVVLTAAVRNSGPPAAAPAEEGCRVVGTDLRLTTAQAANAATIAAVARSRGLAPRATVIALATAQQESRLRNLSYGDRDSLGLFQQRPSQGWGTEAQVQDPVHAAGRFFDGLVEVPGWETGRLTDVAQAVQISGFPEAYQQWEPMAGELAAALLSSSPAQLTCSYLPAAAAGPVATRAAAVADVVRREAGPPTVSAGGLVSVADAGWPEATWAVASAERLQLTAVSLAGWRWTPAAGWTDTGAGVGELTLAIAA